MLLDLAGTADAAQTMVGVTNQAKKGTVSNESMITTQGGLTA